jgi:hypothetical protein
MEKEFLAINDIIDTLVFDENGYSRRLCEYDAFDSIDDAVWLLSSHKVDVMKSHLAYQHLMIERDIRMHLADALEYFAIDYYVKTKACTHIQIELWDEIISITNSPSTRTFKEIKKVIDDYKIK